MILDVDILITLFEKYSDKKTSSEIGEQEAVHGGPKRGKANMLSKGGEKWETGMNRGVANQIW